MAERERRDYLLVDDRTLVWIWNGVNGSVLGNSVTPEHKISSVRPAIGKKLIARSTVLSSGKRKAVFECKVIAVSDKGETLVAVAKARSAKLNNEIYFR